MKSKKIADRIVKNGYFYSEYDDIMDSKIFFTLVEKETDHEPSQQMQGGKFTYKTILDGVEGYYFFESRGKAKEHYISIKNIQDIKNEYIRLLEEKDLDISNTIEKAIQPIYNRNLWQRIINKRV